MTHIIPFTDLHHCAQRRIKITFITIIFSGDGNATQAPRSKNPDALRPFRLTILKYK